MSFATLYRISFYLMLFLATLALSIDAGADYPLSPLYPLGVAIAGVIALLTVDRNPARGLPRDLATLLAIGSVAPSLFEYWYDPWLLVLAMGHWLVFLQLIKMFLPKTVEDDWFLFLLGLTQVVVGAFLPGERIGIVIILWAICSLWTLGLFYLRREALRPAVGGAPEARVTPAPDPKDPYPGLVDFSFLYSAAKVAFMTLALGGLIFLLMPRWENLSRARRGNTNSSSHLTGFSDNVRLGQMGEILESEEVVMSVEFYDELNDRIEPPTEPLWRGVSLQIYEDGGWFRRNPEPIQVSSEEFAPPLPGRTIKQRIRLESKANEILFAMRPIVRAEGPDLLMNRHDGTLYRGDLRPRVGYLIPFNRNPGAFEYTVISNLDSSAVQYYEQLPFRRDFDTLLLGVPDDLRDRINPIVELLLKDLPADDFEARAQALEHYLRDSGEFTYSLNMQVVDPAIDPIADFLFNRKNGHCEYFASALAMLLRTAGIPSRIVNGFRGGDWNDLGEVMVVRKKHAHSWVEALVGRDAATGRPFWLMLDGTPSLERNEVLAQVGGSGKSFRKFSDYLRYLWVFYVVGFDADRQNQAIYEPIRNLLLEAQRGFRLMATNLRGFLRNMLSFSSARSFFSLRGFVVSFVGLLLLALVYKILSLLWRRLLRPWRATGEDDADKASAVAFYRRLTQILSEIGLKRPPAETPREFALRSSAALASRGPESRLLADVPTQVVETFYQIRYGGRSVPGETLSLIDEQLDALEAGLRPPS